MVEPRRVAKEGDVMDLGGVVEACLRRRVSVRYLRGVGMECLRHEVVVGYLQDKVGAGCL